MVEKTKEKELDEEYLECITRISESARSVLVPFEGDLRKRYGDLDDIQCLHRLYILLVNLEVFLWFENFVCDNRLYVSRLVNKVLEHLINIDRNQNDKEEWVIRQILLTRCLSICQRIADDSLYEKVQEELLRF